MVDHAVEPLEQFCRSHGVTGAVALHPIRAGRNSQVFLVSSGDDRWVLKHYYQAPGANQRDRLGTEYGFLVFLRQMGVAGVPEPLGLDRASNLALYSCLPGLRPGTIHSQHISQAARFIARINGARATAQAEALPLAADACLGWGAHLALAESRITRLLAVEAESGVAREAREFVKTRVQALWEKVQIELAPRLEWALLPPEDRILSPSDFGFHNALEYGADLSFVDFEYAGWDDPAKLICDFMCQPEVPVTQDQGQQFMAELLEELPGAEGVARRVELLSPVHRLKWCCILLNEFRMEDRKRREHAGLASDRLLREQLGKAQWYFDTHLAALI